MASLGLMSEVSFELEPTLTCKSAMRFSLRGALSIATREWSDRRLVLVAFSISAVHNLSQDDADTLH